MKKFGLIGEKLTHSLSPEIHDIFYKSMKYNYTYNLYEVDKNNVKNVINSLKTLGINGVNVTIPYKESFISELDMISQEAQKIGAINTILLKDNKTYGYNSDYYGFWKMLLRGNAIIKDNEFYVLGSGGAAKAIVHLLLDKGAKVYLVSRDKVSAKSKFNNLNIEFLDYSDLEDIEETYAIVNTTPCGMFPKVDTTPVSREILKKFKVACDIVYNPLMTRFLKDAKEEGVQIIGGLYMLVAQAMKAEEIWNDLVINEQIEEKIYEVLAEKFR